MILLYIYVVSVIAGYDNRFCFNYYILKILYNAEVSWTKG